MIPLYRRFCATPIEANHPQGLHKTPIHAHFHRWFICNPHASPFQKSSYKLHARLFPQEFACKSLFRRAHVQPPCKSFSECFAWNPLGVVCNPMKGPFQKGLHTFPMQVPFQRGLYTTPWVCTQPHTSPFSERCNSVI